MQKRKMGTLSLKAFVMTTFGVVVVCGFTAVGASITYAKTVLPKIQPCFGKAVMKPSSYVIACADANTEVVSLHWTSWKVASASATGKYEYNTCTPTCVAGHFVKYPATVALGKIKRTGSNTVFSSMTVIYHPTPKHSKKVTVSLPLKAFS